MIAGLRAEAGFGPLPTELNELWMVHDRLIVTTLKALDEGPSNLALPAKFVTSVPCSSESVTAFQLNCHGLLTILRRWFW